MKKFLAFIITLVVIAGLAFLAWHFFGPQIEELFRKGKDKVDVLTGEKVELVVYEFYEDADTPDYIQSSKVKKVAVEPDKPYTYEPQAVNHFTLNESQSVLSVDSAASGDIIKVVYDRNKVSVTFNGGEAELKTGQSATKQFKYEQTIKPSDYPLYNNPGYKADNDDVKATDGLVININWAIKANILTINLAEGCEITELGYERVGDSNTYRRAFTYFDSFSLPTPVSEIYTFLQYELSNGTPIVQIENIDNDLMINAVFTETLYTISFMSVLDEYDNPVPYAFYPAITKQPGKKVNAPKVAPTDQIPGYGLTWYTAENEAFVFDYMPNHNVELYGKWEQDTGVSFLGGLDDDTIESFEELVALYDYVYFSYDTTGKQYTVNYPYEDLQAEFQKIAETEASTYHGNGKILASFSGNKLTLKMEADARSYEAKKTAPACATVVHPYGLYVTPTGLRSSDYNDFYIEKLTHIYPVETSNQLLFVVEHGYKPICATSSLAEHAYEKAKVILRNIISDDMSDFEKAEAIFNYLVMNVQYDNNVLTLADDATDPWYNYDAYFIEGVLNNKKSVCDGLAKTYSLLCNMEGIPCVEVNGNNHAWCKVKINNIWYVVDPTHGNTQISGTDWSIMDHTHFLMSDAEKTALGYSTKVYSEIKCTHQFNYFKYKEFTFDGKQINLVVETADDLANIIMYCYENYESLTNASIDFYYNQINFQQIWDFAWLIVWNHYPSFKQAYSAVGCGSYQVCKIIFG